MRGSMIRFAAISTAALGASSAWAGPIGAEFREDKSFEGTPGLPADLRVFNLHVLFDDDLFQDAVVQMFQPSAASSFGIRKTDGLNQGASFFQIAAGGDLAPSASDIASDPAVEFDSFVSIGQKVADGDTSMTDSDFAFTSDRVFGGWFNSNPANRQGEGEFNPDTGLYETFVGQFAITGLDEGAALNAPAGPGDQFTLFGDVFSGGIVVSWQDPTGDPSSAEIVFAPIPGPSTGAVAGVAGLALLGRRRLKGGPLR